MGGGVRVAGRLLGEFVDQGFDLCAVGFLFL